MPKKPLSAEAKTSFAYVKLSSRLRLNRSTNRSRRTKHLTVEQVTKREWRVSGGQCEHRVIQQDGHLICVDHSPAHIPMSEGRACTHEAAVRKHLIREMAATMEDA